MACDAQTLITLARSTDGFGKLSHRDILLGLAAYFGVTLNGWSAATAMTNAKDYNRLSYRQILECLLQVLCGGGGGGGLPNFAIPYDNMSDYSDALPVSGLNGGVNGNNPVIAWISAYAGGSGWTAVQVYDNMSDYGDGVLVNGLNGGVNGIGTWNSAYAAR